MQEPLVFARFDFEDLQQPDVMSAWRADLLDKILNGRDREPTTKKSRHAQSPAKHSTFCNFYPPAPPHKAFPENPFTLQHLLPTKRSLRTLGVAR